MVCYCTAHTSYFIFLIKVITTRSSRLFLPSPSCWTEDCHSRHCTEDGLFHFHFHFRRMRPTLMIFQGCSGCKWRWHARQVDTRTGKSRYEVYVEGNTSPLYPMASLFPGVPAILPDEQKISLVIIPESRHFSDKCKDNQTMRSWTLLFRVRFQIFFVFGFNPPSWLGCSAGRVFYFQLKKKRTTSNSRYQFWKLRSIARR